MTTGLGLRSDVVTHRQIGLTLLLGGLLALIASPPALAEPVRVPGTRASLARPKGFAAADKFPGFQMPEQQASIMVTELPAPIVELMKGMTRKELRKKGMKVITAKRQPVEGRDGMLVYVSQGAAGTEFLKWMLVTGDDKGSVMVVGTFPKSASKELSVPVRLSVLSLSWAPSAPIDQFEGLGFQLKPTDRLKVAGRMGNTLILNRTGIRAPAGPDEPLLIVGTSISETEMGDLKTFAEARAHKTAQLKDITNLAGKPLDVGGAKGYEIVADGKDAKTGTPMRLYQVLAPHAGGYLIVHGLISSAEAAAFVPEFRRVTASLQFEAIGSL